LKRGEIWTASGGPDYAGKPRPVLIVQHDSFAETASITICPLTTHAIDAPLARPAIESRPENGLHETSFAMVDKITTVPRNRLDQQIGMLSPREMAPINQAMMVFLGLAGSARG